MALLPFVPQFSSAGSSAPLVRKAQFGDGYQQRSADGINHVRKKWSLTFTLNNADGWALLQFFEAKGGVTAFEWKPPTEAGPLSFVCDSWDYQPLTTEWTRISANFYQVFEL